MVILVIAAFVAGYLIGRARPPAVMAMEISQEDHLMAGEHDAVHGMIPAQRESELRF
jgi:hypothetical protein